MFKNFEEMMNIIVDSQTIVFDDELSSFIRKYDCSELKEEELDLVSAAKKSSFEVFLEKYK